MQVSAQAISFIDDTPYSGEGQYEHLPTEGQGSPQRSSSSNWNSQQQVSVLIVGSLTAADASSVFYTALTLTTASCKNSSGHCRQQCSRCGTQGQQ